MSQNFVTPNELDQRLGAYERLGESQKACGQMEESLKKYVRAQLEASQMQITTLVEERAVQLYQKVDVQAKKYIDNLATQIHDSTLKTISSSVDMAKRDLMSDLGLVIKSKISEAGQSLTSSQKSFEAALEKVFWTKLDSFQSQIRAEISDFEKIWLDRAAAVAEKAVGDVREGVSHLTKTKLEEHLYRIEKIIETLRSDLTIEMSKKLVDKQAIEQKMRDIEAELTKKAQSVIDFNINQARTQMEQSAKAEVRDGIKTAASQIMSGLT